MERMTLVLSMALLALGQSCLAKPVLAAGGSATIRLTPISRLPNDNCYESLDPRGLQAVRYFKDDGMWTGINGKAYHFRMSDYITGQKGSGLIEVSTDRRVRIVSRGWSEVRINGKIITVRNVEVQMDEAKKVFRLYEICPATGPDGD